MTANHAATHSTLLQILAASQLTAEFNLLLVALAREETEHTWEIIDKALKRFHAVVRGGAAKFTDEFIRGLKDKQMANGIIRSVSFTVWTATVAW